MDNMTQKGNFFSHFLMEAEAYKDFSTIEKLIYDGGNLTNIPFAPLYISLKDQSTESLLSILPRLSESQRSGLIDLSVWTKDVFDVQKMNDFVQLVYSVESENVKKEFIQSETFYLYLKGTFEIQTFDQEDPEYPDHDRFFLTDDSAFIFIYKEDFSCVEEVRSLLKFMYAELGVESSFMILMQIIYDSFTVQEEKEYESKKSRLSEFGLMDYFDALQLISPLNNLKALHHFLDRVSGGTGELEDLEKNQSVHPLLPYVFNKHAETLMDEISLVENSKRQDFLKFNFILLFNSFLSIHNIYQEDQKKIVFYGDMLKEILLLGLDYTKLYFLNYKFNQKDLKQSIFNFVNFVDIFRVGDSLIKNKQKLLKAALKKYHYDQDANFSFLGSYWCNFVENSLKDIPRIVIGSLGSEKISSCKKYDNWCSHMEQFIQLLPFIHQFHLQFQKLKKENKLQDSFYFNYDVASIDFEALILSSLCNHILDQKRADKGQKLGLTLVEFKELLEYISKSEKNSLSLELKDKVDQYLVMFGLSLVPNIQDYLIQLLFEHLSDFDYENFSDEDFRHVGGPIIFNIK